LRRGFVELGLKDEWGLTLPWASFAFNAFAALLLDVLFTEDRIELAADDVVFDVVFNDDPPASNRDDEDADGLEGLALALAFFAVRYWLE
jgi:hypothetical protein